MTSCPVLLNENTERAGRSNAHIHMQFPFTRRKKNGGLLMPLLRKAVLTFQIMRLIQIKYIYFLLLRLILPAGSESWLQISRPRACAPTHSHRMNYWYSQGIFVVQTACCCWTWPLCPNGSFSFYLTRRSPTAASDTFGKHSLSSRKLKRMQRRVHIKDSQSQFVVFKCQQSIT